MAHDSKGNSIFEDPCLFFPFNDDAEGHEILRPSAGRVTRRRLRIANSGIPIPNRAFSDDESLKLPQVSLPWIPGACPGLDPGDLIRGSRE